MIQIISIRDEIDLTAPGGQRRLKLLIRKGSRTVELPVSQEQASVIIQLRDEVSTDPRDVAEPASSPPLSLAALINRKKVQAAQEEEPIRLGGMGELGTFVDDEDDL